MTGMTLKAFTDGQCLPQGLAELLLSVSDACRQISRTVRSGSAIDQPGEAGLQNIQGETQKKLDVVANEILLSTCGGAPSLIGMASEEMETVHALRPAPEGPAYLLVFDPLDGSSNIEVNVSIGTIFSVLPAAGAAGQHPTEADFLQPGSRQVAAGYVVYGPQTTMVLTTGRGVAAFRLEPLTEEWVLTDANVTVPAETSEFAINASNMRHWAEPIGRYIADCMSGKDGPRNRNFNMRWVASMVADVHRIMVRGGVFLYPWDAREPDRPGKLRLLYEGNPMAMLVEQAGGAASDGEIRIMDVPPTSLHQRVPVILGSKAEVETILSYR